MNDSLWQKNVNRTIPWFSAKQKSSSDHPMLPSFFAIFCNGIWHFYNCMVISSRGLHHHYTTFTNTMSGNMQSKETVKEDQHNDGQSIQKKLKVVCLGQTVPWDSTCNRTSSNWFRVWPLEAAICTNMEWENRKISEICKSHTLPSWYWRKTTCYLQDSSSSLPDCTLGMASNKKSQ